MKLTIDPATGMSGDMLIAALIDAGVTLAGKKEMAAEVALIMGYAGNLLGKADIAVEKIVRGLNKGTELITRLTMNNHSVSAKMMGAMFDQVFSRFGFAVPERMFAERAFKILCRAEEHAHLILENKADNTHTLHAESDWENIHLHEAQDILIDIAGAARAMHILGIDWRNIICLSPVFYGGGTVTFSHGTFPVPAPAVKEIIETHKIPVQLGPVEKELLTPTGASLLASLQPIYVTREGYDAQMPSPLASGIGWGTISFPESVGRANGLIVHLADE